MWTIKKSIKIKLINQHKKKCLSKQLKASIHIITTERGLKNAIHRAFGVSMRTWITNNNILLLYKRCHAAQKADGNMSTITTTDRVTSDSAGV